MSKLIPPTPGRVVWYFPSQHEIDAKAFSYEDRTKPLAATVAYVHTDRLVNLSIVDQVGAQFRRTSVQLLQEDDPVPHTSEGPYATWMPYQLSQALKEDLQALQHAALSVAVEAMVAEQTAQPVAVGIDPAAPGADKTVETTVYPDGTSATGTAPLPGESPVTQGMADAKQLADAVAGLPPEGSASDSGKSPEEQAPA